MAYGPAFYAFQVSIPYAKFGSKKKKAEVCFEFADLIKYNEVVTPTMRLCVASSIFFITELQTAGYNGAARTLRCMLETAVEACEFQTQENRPTYDLLKNEYDIAIGSNSEKT